MATHKVGLSADQKTIHIAVGANLLPAAYTQIGTFDHEHVDTDAQDELNAVHNQSHTFFHHVQDILGRTKQSNPTEAALFPYNITDMQSINIIDGVNSAPINVTAPTITGTAQVGQTLTSVPGTWTGGPTFTRQWKADGVNIAGATDTTYVVHADYTDDVITCAVTASNAGGSTTLTGAGTAAVIAA